MIANKTIKSTSFYTQYATAIYFIMSIQLVAIEGLTISPIKVGLMALSILIFIFRVPYLSKAFWTSFIYWSICFVTSIFNGEMRFSTLGYMGMFLITFVVFYNLLYSGAFTPQKFKQILKIIILLYGGVLILQQICIIIGIRNLPILNLVGFGYYSWNRLPTLSCEPSHTARIISAAMFGYIKCSEIEKGRKVLIKDLFNKENKTITIAYLWLVLTMGSATGWIGFGILCIYFIRFKTFIYVIPIFISLYITMSVSGNKQFNRVKTSIEATLTGNTSLIYKADGSASVRIIPLINTLTKSDISQKETWVGKGTYAANISEKNNWRNLDRKLGIVEQYGLLGLIGSLILLYTCSIRRLFSLETLYFIILMICSLGNEYFTWSMVLVFTAIRYFQTNYKYGCLSNHN